MPSTRRVGMVLLSVVIVLPGVTAAKQNLLTYSISTGNDIVIFVARPELGYVVEFSTSGSAMRLANASQQGTEGEDREYLNVTGRPEILVVLGRHPLIHNEKNIRTLSGQADTEYVAPLFSLDGQTIAIIPEIIVRLDHETDIDRLEDLCWQVDCTIVRNLLYTQQEFLISTAARNAEDVLTIVEVLGSADFVEWAYPNIVFKPKLCGQPTTNESNRVDPNDEYFQNQWHLNTIRAPEAWAYTTGDPNIVIAVLDEGFEINHPDLVNNIWTNPGEIPGNGFDDDGNGLVDDVHGWDFVRDDNDVNPDYTSHAHGTACAGLIAAQGNNNLGVTGVTWNCTIMPVRISPLAAEDLCTLTEPVDGLRYAATQGADVISNSWAVPDDCDPIHSAIMDISRSDGIGRNGKGSIVVFASGNYGRSWGGSVTYPAKYPEVIAVGAIDQNDNDWYYNGHWDGLDIVAPSGDIEFKGNLWTTDISTGKGYNNRDSNILDYTDKMGGTSGACPIVAGVAALILSIDPNLTNIEVQGILFESARDLGSSGWDGYYGFGCVDAYEAVTLALNSTGFTLYVDDDALNDPGPDDPNVSDPNEDGSLEHPFDSIQEAIDKSFIGGTVIVLPGTYTGKGNRDIDFCGRAIVVRSQEGPETCIIDCEAKGRGFRFHSEEGANSLLEGFTITNAYHYSSGGGVFISDSSPTITNCTLNGNSADAGGGLCNITGSPTITRCTFNGNSANDDGGGLYNLSGSPIIVDCLFRGNSVRYYNGKGGGISNHSFLSPIIVNCTFTGNTSKNNGGGIYNSSFSKPYITNCTITGNSAAKNGGGTFNDTYSEPIMVNFTFSGNSANYGGGVYNDRHSKPVLTNCILWDDKPDEIYPSYGGTEEASKSRGP